MNRREYNSNLRDAIEAMENLLESIKRISYGTDYTPTPEKIRSLAWRLQCEQDAIVEALNDGIEE